MLQTENTKLKDELKSLQKSLTAATEKLDNLQKQSDANRVGINKASKELGIKIKETGESSEKKLSALDQSLSQNTLYAIIGLLVAILVSVLLYFLLNRRQKSHKTAMTAQIKDTHSSMVTQLQETKTSIEENLIKEFGKQTEMMDAQMEQLVAQRKQSSASPSKGETDHALALKLASEINLIERNLSRMDGKTKGLKQLNRSVGKLKDNLAANGYEMPELLGKPFNQGMKAIVANSIPDDTLEKGIEVITKVLIPQVNHNDIMIQTAQIEVSVGY